MKFKLPDMFNKEKVVLLEKKVQELSKDVASQKGYMKGYATDYPILPGITVSRPSARLDYDTLNRIYRQSSAVRPAVDGTVREITTLPFTIEGFPGQKFDEGHKKAVEDLLHDPNRNKETFRDILAKALTDVLIYDAGAIEKVKSPSGKLVELMARDGSTFTPVGDEHGVLERYEQAVTGEKAKFEKDEIIYMLLYPRAGSLWGQPIIEAIVDEVATLLYSNEHIAKSFTEDEIPPGVLNLGDIGKEAYLAAKEDFQVKKGQKKDFKLRVVYGTRNVDWIDFKRPAREMQLNELRHSIERIVFRNFGVVPMEIGEVADVNRAIPSYVSVLTKQGFKKPYNIDIKKDELATINPKTLKLEYQKAIRQYVNDFDGNLVHFKSVLVDAPVTPTHRMWMAQNRSNKTKSYFFKPLEFKEAKDIKGTFGFLRSPSGWDGPEVKYFTIPNSEVEIPMDIGLEFLGYFISEGSLGSLLHNARYMIDISQKNKAVVSKIHKCLSKLPYHVREHVFSRDGVTHFQFSNKALAQYLRANAGTKSKERHIPEELLEVSQRQLKILFNALMDGDGWWQRRGQSGIFCTSSWVLRDQVQVLALKLGYAASVHTVKPAGEQILNGEKVVFKNETYQVCLHKSSHPYFVLSKSKNIKEKYYKGKVYCFEVPNHNLIFRNGGKVSYHGNSTAMFQMRVAQSRLLIPIVNMLTYYIDKEIIQEEFGFFDVRFILHMRIYEDEDPESRAIERLVRCGVKSINQVCAEKGWNPPKEGGDRRFIIVGKRIIFVDELGKMKGDIEVGKILEGRDDGGGDHKARKRVDVGSKGPKLERSTS